MNESDPDALSSVFPMPVNSIEMFHLFSDEPRFSNHLICNLYLNGTIDLAAARRAAEVIAVRHPMLRAGIEDRNGKLFWVDRLDYGYAIQVVESEVSIEPRSLPYLDLSRHGGGRLWLFQSENEKRCRVTMQIHHAVADGLGGQQAIRDWLTAYANVIAGKEPASGLPRLDNEQLAGRGNLGLLQRRVLGKLPLQAIAILGAGKFMMRSIDPIAKIDDSPPIEPGKASTHYVKNLKICGKRVEDLKNYAASRSASLNDLMVCRVFLALDEWRRQWQDSDDDSWLRIVVPMSIRTYGDRRLSAVNRAAFVQLDRRQPVFENADGLLWGINYELANVQRWQLDKTFLIVMRLMSLFPGRLKKMTRKPRCRATTFLTNLGAPIARLHNSRSIRKSETALLEVGNLTLTDVDIIAPIRTHTPLGFTIIRLGDQLKISMSYDSASMTHWQADDLKTLLDMQFGGNQAGGH